MAIVLDKKSRLGKVILTRLYLMGKNQAWLAKQTRMNQSYICTMCTKNINPKIETLIKISQALELDVNELIDVIKSN